MTKENEFKAGVSYFLQGWQLLTRKGLRRFVIMPIVLNVILLSAIFWLFLLQVNQLIELLDGYLPEWLNWINLVLFPLAILMSLLFFYFAFTTLAGFIAAPFNALLSEKVEEMLTGKAATEMSMLDLLRDIPRMLVREWQKLCYSLPKLIALFLLGFVPFLGQTVIPVLTFIFTAWLMAIQYCDYPFDNHKIAFYQMQQELGKRKTTYFSFGVLVTCCTFIPLLNFVVMPAAVCGATAMWVDYYAKAFMSMQAKEAQLALPE